MGENGSLSFETAPKQPIASPKNSEIAANDRHRSAGFSGAAGRRAAAYRDAAIAKAAGKRLPNFDAVLSRAAVLAYSGVFVAASDG